MDTLQESSWHNWSRLIQCKPQQIVKPVSIDAATQTIKACSSDNRHVRVVGAGHSFTPLAQTDDVMMSLEHLQGIEEINSERGTVTVLAGTPLNILGEALYAHGLAQENLGGIDAQSIAGAISTGTHGTGRCFGTLSTQVESLTIITAAGELLECSSEQNPDIFKAAQLSLGTLGVIVKVKLRVVAAKCLCFKSYRQRLSHRLFVAPRMVRLQAMEYALAVEHVQTVLSEIQACINRHRFQVHFPLGCRFVHADDIWLSPAYQRDSAYIAVHMYQGMEYKSYFQHVEEIFQHYNGRPHWGKIHTQDAASLAALYPRWHDFRRIRAALDPQGLFLNDYLRRLLDADGPVPSDVTNSIAIDSLL